MAMDASSFPILSVSIVGILSIALLLLSYYLFLTRCGLLFFWRTQDDLHLHHQDHHRISAVSVQRSGLEAAAIRRISTFRWHPLLPEEEASSSSSDQCAVCLADFRHGERLRLLPQCRHAFHIDCIDAWLQDAANCPLCRAPAAGLEFELLQQQAWNHNDYHLGLHIPRRDIAAAIDITSPAEAKQPRSSSSFLPMRRSLSMDSSTDKRFYLALQRILQQHQHSGSDGKGGDSSAAAEYTYTADGRSSSRRLRRSFFSLSHSRGGGSRSGSAILPL